MASHTPFRVLTLDGGGVRGAYTATYLSQLSRAFSPKGAIGEFDFGAAFDLIVGTSTGGFVACALAAKVPLSEVVDLYKNHAAAIFQRPLPRGLLGLPWDILRRPGALARGTAALEKALTAQFNGMTLGDLYKQRGIALAITAVNISQNRSWVFKTPHLSFYRDAGYRLVDVCLATSAAPIYRSLACIKNPEGEGSEVFADGGLWANNPVLVGLIEALEMSEPGQAIEVFSLGTCSQPGGKQLSPNEIHRGLVGWMFGSDAATASIGAQEFAYDNMARMLAAHVDRPCRVIRFPREELPSSVAPFLSLDDTRPKAFEALVRQARHDADMTFSRCKQPNNDLGELICGLFKSKTFDVPLAAGNSAGSL